MVVPNVIEALDIDGDDSVNIVVAVEQAFGIKISDGEAEACQTVGDLFRVICTHVPTVERSDAISCLTAVTFRELRRAIMSLEPALDLRPATPVSSFAGFRDHRGWYEELLRTGLSVPQPMITGRVMSVGLALFGLSVAAGTVGTLSYGVVGLVTVALLYAPADLLFRYYARRRWAPGKTVGDLAKETAAFSVGQAVKERGAIRTRELWEALVVVLRPYARCSVEFGFETRFFAKQN